VAKKVTPKKAAAAPKVTERPGLSVWAAGAAWLASGHAAGRCLGSGRRRRPQLIRLRAGTLVHSLHLLTSCNITPCIAPPGPPGEEDAHQEGGHPEGQGRSGA
jgi:hypothetical protein